MTLSGVLAPSVPGPAEQQRVLVPGAQPVLLGPGREHHRDLVWIVRIVKVAGFGGREEEFACPGRLGFLGSSESKQEPGGYAVRRRQRTRTIAFNQTREP